MTAESQGAAADRDTAQVIAPPPLIYLVGLGVGFGLDALLPDASVPAGVRFGPFAGIALLANAPWALLPLPVVLAVIQRGVIEREERYLERRFGQEYRRFRARTRRWI